MHSHKNSRNSLSQDPEELTVTKNGTEFPTDVGRACFLYPMFLMKQGVLELEVTSRESGLTSYQ